MADNRCSPEEIFSTVFYSQKFFTPFNWDSAVRSCILKNVSKNRAFAPYKKFYDKLSTMYYRDDIEKIVFGFYLGGGNMFSFCSADLGKCARVWMHLEDNFVKMIKKDLTLNTGIINNNISVENLMSAEVCWLTKAYIAITENDILDRIKEDSKKTKSLEKTQNYKQIFRHTQLLKLLSERHSKK